MYFTNTFSHFTLQAGTKRYKSRLCKILRCTHNPMQTNLYLKLFYFIKWFLSALHIIKIFLYTALSCTSVNEIFQTCKAAKPLLNNYQNNDLISIIIVLVLLFTDFSY